MFRFGFAAYTLFHATVGIVLADTVKRLSIVRKLGLILKFVVIHVSLPLITVVVVLYSTRDINLSDNSYLQCSKYRDECFSSSEFF